MSKTLEELGYEKLECDEYVAFGCKDKEILFDKQKRDDTLIILTRPDED